MNPKSLANLRPFPTGTSPNPGGKPVNARNRVTKKFLEALADDFEAHGQSAIEDCRLNDSGRYLAIVAGLLPKEFIVDRPTEGLSDAELATALEFIRSRLVELDQGQAGEGATIEGIAQSVEGVPAVSETA